MTHHVTRTDDERVGLDTSTLESLSIAVLKIDRLERETLARQIASSLRFKLGRHGPRASTKEDHTERTCALG
jgi:hypothetical protein